MKDKKAPDTTPVVVTPSTLLVWLYDRAAPQLSPNERRHIRGQIDGVVETIARNGQEVAHGIATLVAADTENGSFRDPEAVSALLFHLGDAFGQVVALSEISNRIGCAPSIEAH
jgi:hypothetical protein